MTHLSLAEFRRIKAMAKARKSRRAEKVAENAEIGVLGGILGPTAAQGATQESSRRPSRPKLATGKPRPLSQKLQIEAIKKRILGTGGLWSQAVRKRDGNRCVMCGATGVLHAHHYLFHRSHSMALAVDPANGATLCYTCHLIKVHQRADGDFIARLLEKMVCIVGEEKTWEMREKAKHPEPLGLDFWQGAELALKNLLQNRC